MKIFLSIKYKEKREGEEGKCSGLVEVTFIFLSVKHEWKRTKKEREKINPHMPYM